MATGTLPSDLRSRLERAAIEARDAAEVGARAALESLAVHHHEPFPHMKPAQRELRNHLRARARQLGDRQDGSGRLAIDHLAAECAYEHWHRMLFARFLAENNLLVEPDSGMAISLAEAEELAKDAGIDVWAFASRCAQDMLPQIFRPDDPLLQITFATEHMLKLEKLLASLPAAVFTASDALGWVYQFWQSKKKDEVNKSEVKIGADEISAVTQLFTEPYMVEFLLHNTLGAWWAGRKLSPKDAAAAKSEDELRAKLGLPDVGWEYLRFVRGEDGEGGPWRPAAGTFDGWPKTAAELRVLDPCCGSGHFLVAALHHLVPMRMADEGLSAAEAVDAVLRDNLHGLEIDERCCQIAAFALAFAAWTYPNAGGYRPLPELHIACTGVGPQSAKAQWLELAEKAAAKGRMPVKRDLLGKEDSLLSSTVANALEAIYDLFAHAPTLGSLCDPRRVSKELYVASYETLLPLLAEVFKAETDDDARERVITAAGMAKAAELLTSEYALVVTNVPYLQSGDQATGLSDRLKTHFPDGWANLATAFLERMTKFVGRNGSVAAVTMQDWLFKDKYRRFRRHYLENTAWNLLARLGPGAFETISGEVVNVCLLVVSRAAAGEDDTCMTIDVQGISPARAKGEALISRQCRVLHQLAQLRHPRSVVVTAEQGSHGLLEELASFNNGICTGDRLRFVHLFWEIDSLGTMWSCQQSTVQRTQPYGGREQIFLWEGGNGRFREFVVDRLGENMVGSWIRGASAWGRRGVLVSAMGELFVSLYNGHLFDENTVAVIPADEADLPSVWAFMSSAEYAPEVRKVDKSLKVRGPLVRVPYDTERWAAVAAKAYPDGLPEPESDDPTQWLFHGRPDEAQKGTELQVAVARLLGYRWPAELDGEMRLSKRARALVKQCEDLSKFVDDDGIVCIPAVRGEEPAVERLLRLLDACDIEPGVDLDDWLRNSFFEAHCKLFHDRPFVWHVWDGRKRDGFHALVNYHKLAEGGGRGRRLLENLTYAYLGEWITRQKDGVKRGEGGAEDRLAAALELQKRLEAILAGEPPFDLFVRWKPLDEQAIGWEPDINDGVRLNIRPFLASDLPGGKKGAGILRHKPNIKWAKDRGKEPERPKADYPWFWSWDERTEDFAGGKKFDGNRWNDCHYTNRVKQAARERRAEGADR